MGRALHASSRRRVLGAPDPRPADGWRRCGERFHSANPGSVLWMRCLSRRGHANAASIRRCHQSVRAGAAGDHRTRGFRDGHRPEGCLVGAPTAASDCLGIVCAGWPRCPRHGRGEPTHTASECRPRGLPPLRWEPGRSRGAPIPGVIRRHHRRAAVRPVSGPAQNPARPRRRVQATIRHRRMRLIRPVQGACNLLRSL